MQAMVKQDFIMIFNCHLAQIDLTPIFMIAIWILVKMFALAPFILLLGILYLILKKRIKKMSPDDKSLLIKATIGASIGFMLVVLIPGVFENIHQSTLIGIASIVIVSYLPFAIASLQDPDNELHWDKQALIEGVLDLLLLTMLLVVGFIIPILFWDTTGRVLEFQDVHYLQVLLFAFFVIGVSGYIWSILKIYGWMNGLGKENRLTFRHRKRQEFLLSLPNIRKTGVWTAKTWQQLPKLALIEQEQLIKVFLQHMKELENEEDAVIIIDDLDYNLRFLSLHRPKIYSSLFCLAFRHYKEYQQEASKNSLQHLQMSLTKISLSHDTEITKYSELCKLFFRQCKETLKDDNINALSFTIRITEVFFPILQNNRRINVMRSDFPTDWWVTLDRLEPKNDACVLIWFKTYQEWIKENFLSNTLPEGILSSPIVRKVTGVLFPKIHLTLWFYLLHIQELFSRTSKQKIQTTIDAIAKNENGITSIQKQSNTIIFIGSGLFTRYTQNVNPCTQDALKETIGIYKLLDKNRLKDKQQIDKCLEIIQSVRVNYQGGDKKDERLRLETLANLLQILKNNLSTI